MNPKTQADCCDAAHLRVCTKTKSLSATHNDANDHQIFLGQRHGGERVHPISKPSTARLVPIDPLRQIGSRADCFHNGVIRSIFSPSPCRFTLN
jgi:hypothetical protein